VVLAYFSLFTLMPISFMNKINAAHCESTTTRKAGGLDFLALMDGGRQKHVSALIVAVVTGCLAPGLKTTT
jgi:hypothetical protein